MQVGWPRWLPGLVILWLGWQTVQAADYQARGMIVSLQQATLSSELGARITRLPKRLGERFEQGDLLVQLDCELFDAQLQKVAAEKKAAKAKFDNAEELQSYRSISTLELAQASANWQQLQAEHRIARINQRRCRIRAPFDGVVADLQVQAHESVKPQQPLIDIVGHQQLEARVIVPATWIRWLNVGQALTLTLEETQKQLAANISHIGPNIDPGSQTLTVRARLAQTGEQIVLPGMSAMAQFESVPEPNPSKTGEAL